MIAHLGMYGSPDLNEALWIAIRARLGYGPDHLTRSDDYWAIWQSPDLLFSQTCGYPYRAKLHGQVQLVGTPDYALPGCPPGYYRSVFIVRKDDPRQRLADFDGARLAFNEPLSQSGWAAPVHHLLTSGLGPGALVQTGSHAGSITAVADGRADIAGIDAVTWALARQAQMEAADMVHVIAATEPTPGLPFITGAAQDAGRIAQAVSAAIDDVPDTTRTALHLRGMGQIPADTYLSVPTPPPPAEIAPIQHA